MILTHAANLFEMTKRAIFFADSSFGVVTQQIELEPGAYAADADCVLDIFDCCDQNELAIGDDDDDDANGN